MRIRLIALVTSVLFFGNQVSAQDDDLLASLDKNAEQPANYINNAFKSSRVINGHSIEFIGKGVLDTSVLHRFGFLNSGFANLYGLDQATMRFGFDYGVTKDLTIGVGRSTALKEWDGFVKYRVMQQCEGGKHPSKVSVVLVSGITASTAPWTDPTRTNYTTSKLGFYHELIVGRKFSEAFSAQIAPTVVHMNLVKGKDDKNNIAAVGLGARIKLSRRTAFVVDYHYILRPSVDASSTAKAQFDAMKNPLAIGFDVETGGHVFQLHFTNSTGMNEKAFISNTKNSWGKGEVSFGFNLSRVFTVKQKKI